MLLVGQLPALGEVLAGHAKHDHVVPGGEAFLHEPAEIGMDARYAARSATGKYRTTPLRSLWQHAPYFHDGSAAKLEDVVTHYNKFRRLNLSAAQQQDLVQYLKSL